MNLDELQSVQSKERQATSLQNLRSSFYQDAGEFIRDLERERDRAAERADDPFSSPEVRQLSDDIQTARQTVEAIYERRVGKVVKMASIAAADMPTDDEGLTEEEDALFDTLVGCIEDNREHVLDGVLEGEAVGTAPASPDSSGVEPEPGAGGDDGRSEVPPDDAVPPEAAPESDAVDAASLMGADDDADAAAADDLDAPSRPPTDDGVSDAEAPDSDSSADDEGGAGGDAVDRTTVRITEDVGEIFGVDERSYELNSEDVVTLPTANAEPLVKREAAEKLE